MKRNDMIVLISKYYQSIGRVKTPKYEDYSLGELRKCILLFNLNIVRL
jgi:hypothetical protein